MGGYVDIVEPSGSARGILEMNETWRNGIYLEGKRSSQLLHLTSSDLSPHVHFVHAVSHVPQIDAHFESNQSNANANFLHVKQAKRNIAEFDMRDSQTPYKSIRTDRDHAPILARVQWGWREQNVGVTHKAVKGKQHAKKGLAT